MGARIYVGNLPFTANEQDVRSLFESNGRGVREVKIIEDRDTGRPRGFAFVEMNTDAEADAAIQELNGVAFGGRTLTVNLARDREGGGGGGRGYGGGGGGGGGLVEERNSVAVMLLPIVTCGVYLYYWIYKTSEELRAQTGDTSINPGTDLLLTIVTCGLWGMFVEYRNVQKVHAVMLQYDPSHKDQSQTVLILNLAAFVVGVTGFIATYMVQEELNQLARATRSRALPR